MLDKNKILNCQICGRSEDWSGLSYLNSTDLKEKSLLLNDLISRYRIWIDSGHVDGFQQELIAKRLQYLESLRG